MTAGLPSTPCRLSYEYPRSKIIIVAVVAVALAILTSLLWLGDPTKNFLPGADRLNRFGAGAIVGATFLVITLLVYFVAKRTLWDLLQLLIVPLALAAIGFLFTMQQDARQQKIEDQRAEAERELAEQRAQDEALQAYLDQMGSLLKEKDLRTSEKGSEVRTLARTLTVLSRLDSSRQGSVVRFLSEAGLINRENPINALGGTRDQRAGDRAMAASGLGEYALTLGGIQLEKVELQGARSQRHRSQPR
jgi:hypothetical protein